MRIGTVVDVLFDPDKGKLAALLVKPSVILSAPKYLTTVDLLAIENHAILSHKDALVDLQELPRIQELQKSKRPILHQTAQTTQKKPLGKVDELYIDDLTGNIIQLQTRLLLAKRLFPVEDVVRITKQAVVFKNDTQVKTETSILDDASSPEATVA